MRVILSLLILVVAIVAVLIMTDVINIRQTEEGRMPEIAVEEGEMPEFEVDTPEVEVGTEERTVEVPSISVRDADEGAADRESDPEPVE